MSYQVKEFSLTSKKFDFWMILIGVAFFACIFWTFKSCWQLNQSKNNVVINALIEEAGRLDDDIFRVTMPAMNRGRLVSIAPSTHNALQSGDKDLLTDICNRAITNATEIDAIAVFNSDGEILAINTVFSDGDPIESNRVSKILGMSFDSREIIQTCRINDTVVEALEFQTTCDITPAFFDSTGLSIAHSVPIFTDSGELLGIVSTRVRFDRLSDVIEGRKFADGKASFMFITESGEYFDESVNAGSQPPVPFEVIQDALKSKKDGMNESSVSISKDHVLALTQFSELETLDTGGIYACVSVPRLWFSQRHRDQIFAAATPPGLLALVFLLTGLGRYHASKVLDDARSKIIITERLELALSGSQDAIFDWDLGNGSMFFAPRWAELLRCHSEEVGDSFETILKRVASRDLRNVESTIGSFIDHGSNFLEMEFRFMTNDGSILWVLLRAVASRSASGVAERISGSVADISSLKAVEDKMRLMLDHDQLTGLTSRSKFTEELSCAYTRSCHSDSKFAVLFLDFDRFKIVNDTLGHNIGDELLRSIADRLRSNTLSSDTVSRFGGDEFVILFNQTDKDIDAITFANKILTACSEPHLINGHRLVSTASIGVVTSEHSSDGPSGMLRDADGAMYQAKSNGRGCVVEFDERMHQETLKRFELEEDLRNAVAGNQLSLHYQPIIHLESGVPVGAEALLRWVHPDKGMISPAEFIPIAEETNQIYALGEWVIYEACRQVSEWKRSGVINDEFRVSINLSKIQLATPGFVDSLCKTVAEAGLMPNELKLEVTETTIVDNRSGIAHVLDSLQKRGFVVMMDDFGTGHSSLSGLHTLPIDELKIDQSFIHAENANKELIAITSSIVNLAQNLKLRTVGEGIETADDAILMTDLGCMFGQGYYFSKPLQVSDFVEWISQSSQRRAA